MAYDYINRIENMGGVIKCIEQGWIQNEIQNSAYQQQLDLESKKEIIVGVNEFIQKDKKSDVDVLKISEDVATEQIQRLAKFKKNRDNNLVKSYCEKITHAAETDTNLMPLFVEAVKNNVTLGEISDSLRKVFGQYRETVKF